MVMWILLMIVFSQPYEVDHIEMLGEYRSKAECVAEQHRAVDTINEGKYDPVSFGCLQVGFGKTIHPYAGGKNEMGPS